LNKKVRTRSYSARICVTTLCRSNRAVTAVPAQSWWQLRSSRM